MTKILFLSKPFYWVENRKLDLRFVRPEDLKHPAEPVWYVEVIRGNGERLRMVLPRVVRERDRGRILASGSELYLALLETDTVLERWPELIAPIKEDVLYFIKRFRLNLKDLVIYGEFGRERAVLLPVDVEPEDVPEPGEKDDAFLLV